MTHFIVNRSDAIGDTLLTMPIAQIIKKYLPDVKVVFITTPLNQPLFEEQSDIDEIWVMDKKWSWWKKASFLWKKYSTVKSSHYLYVGGSHIPSFIAFIKGINNRGGLLSRWPSFLFLNQGTRQKRSMVEMHETYYNLNLLFNMQLRWKVEDIKELRSPIVLSDNEKTNGKSRLGEFIAENNLSNERQNIFIHPGMTGHTLNWSSRNYARFVIQLEKIKPNEFNYIISQTPSDKKYIDTFNDEIKKNKEVNLEGKIAHFDGAKKGLRDYMTVLSHGDLFLGPSTGTTHIANSLGVKQIGIYSPIKAQSALRWGPLFQDKDKVFLSVPEVVCGEAVKCALMDCPYYECMGKIEVHSIVAKALELLNKERA